MQSGSNPPIVVLTFAERLVAVNARTGVRLWEFAIGKKALFGRIHIEQGRGLFVGKGTLFCLLHQEGTLLWKVELTDMFTEDPNLLAYGGCVILMSQGEAVAYSLEDGACLWHDPFKGYGIHGGAMAAPGVSALLDRRH